MFIPDLGFHRRPDQAQCSSGSAVSFFNSTLDSTHRRNFVAVLLGPAYFVKLFLTCS